MKSTDHISAMISWAAMSERPKECRMLLRFFNLEDIGMVLVPGAKDKGDVLATDGIRQAREMGEKI